MELYYDDKYDFETGEFKGLSKEGEKKYMADLEIFYEVFTGKQKPEEVRKFSDIRLRDYSQANSSTFCSGVRVSQQNPLFQKYADHLKEMVRKTNQNQAALIDVLNRLFVYSDDPQTGKRVVRIHPDLNEDNIQSVVEKTRELVIKLYLTCEVDYVNGVKLYEALVEEILLGTAQNQIKNLEKMTETMLSDDTEKIIQDEEPKQEEVKPVLEEQKEDKEKVV
jgi:hypothetical protein